LRDVGSIPRSETKGKHPSFDIGGEVQFNPIKHAFSGVSPSSEPLHSFVVFRIFVETDGNVGGIGMFDDVRVFDIPRQNDFKEKESEYRESIHVDDERFVAARWSGDFVERLFRFDTLLLFYERKRYDINNGQSEFSTFVRFSFEERRESVGEEFHFLLHLVKDGEYSFHTNSRTSKKVRLFVF